MLKCNIPRDRAQRVDEKNEVIFPVILFTTTFNESFMVINLSKMGYFFVFSADDSKKLVQVWAKDLSASGRSDIALSENVMVNRLWSYRS